GSETRVSTVSEWSTPLTRNETLAITGTSAMKSSYPPPQAANDRDRDYARPGERTATRVVRSERARSPLAAHPGSVCGPGLGGDAAADAGASRRAQVSRLARTLADRGGAGGGSAGGRDPRLAGPRLQPARREPASRGAGSSS